MDTLTVKDIAWLAGLLEGEAHFGYNKGGDHAFIEIAMTDKDVIDRVAHMFGSKTRSRPGVKLHHQPQWRTCVTCVKARAWMMTLFPLLGRRRRDKIKQILDKVKQHPWGRQYAGRQGRQLAQAEGKL